MHLVDFAALQLLAGNRMSGSFQGTSVSIAVPKKVWVEGNDVCELHPFYDGITLCDAVKRNRYKLRGSYLGIIFTCAVQALGDLHAVGVLHRDVNPTNMLLTRTGDIVLLDVSFACRIDSQRVAVENPAFSPPEQLLKKAVPQSDFYSLAATACFLANGREPVPTGGAEKLQEEILNINFGAFYHRAPETWELVHQMLSTAVEDRPKGYRDLLLDPGTWPVDTSLFGVLDLDQLGFMVLSPSGILIGDKDQILGELRTMLKDDTIAEQQLKMDVMSFLDGKNPWLA
jgi:serine/threonine protein kinase